MKWLLHIASWTALIVINATMMQGYGIGLDWWDMAVKWALIAGVFYLNYAWLIPRFLFRRRIVAYVLLVLAGFAVALVANRINSIAAMRRNLSVMEAELRQYADIEQRYAEEGRPLPPPRRPGGGDLGGPGPEGLPGQAMTTREEEYERLLRRYDRTRRFAQGFSRQPLNPFVKHNIGYF